MTGPDPQDEASQDEASQREASQREEHEERESQWQRQRRLAEIFGDVLPETTSDERDPSDGAGRDGASDAWLRSQVPPHHGG